MLGKRTCSNTRTPTHEYQHHFSIFFLNVDDRRISNESLTVTNKEKKVKTDLRFRFQRIPAIRVDKRLYRAVSLPGNAFQEGLAHSIIKQYILNTFGMAVNIASHCSYRCSFWLPQATPYKESAVGYR